MRLALAAALLIALAPPLAADQEAGNVAHVTASSYGRCYAKSVPAERYGDRGVTRVYRVGPEKDVLEHTFNWYSRRLWIACNASDQKAPVGIAVVRVGPWPRGYQASAEQFALGFYYKGETLHEYSALDLAGSPDNVEASESHYRPWKSIRDPESLPGNRYGIEVQTADGRRLRYDLATGEPFQPN